MNAYEEKQIDCILDTFDFKSIQKIMKALDWKWYLGPNYKLKFPTQKQLYDMAKHLLTTCVEKSLGTIQYGGFIVTYKEGEELTLAFVPVSFSVGPHEYEE